MLRGNVIVQAVVFVAVVFASQGEALVCGDGIIDAGETCDDGNNDRYDGCDWECQTGECWTCTGAPSVCTPAAPVVRTIDSTGDVGQYTQIRFGNDGRAIIAYHDVTNRDLKVARCDDAECTSATTRTVDSAGDVGRYLSMAIGSDGFPIIAYISMVSCSPPSTCQGSALKVAHCNDRGCGPAPIDIRTLVSPHAQLTKTSLSRGGDGKPLITYMHVTADDAWPELDRTTSARVIRCSNASCVLWTTSVIESATFASSPDFGADTGFEQASIVGLDGRMLLAFNLQNLGTSLLTPGQRVAHCSDIACTSAVVHPTIETFGPNSISLGADGLGVVATSGGNLVLTHCGNELCSTSSSAVVEGSFAVGSSRIRLGTDGRNRIAYYDTVDEDLRIAHCNSDECPSVTTSIVDSGGNVGDYADITEAPATNKPWVSYYDVTNGDLKVAYLCSTRFGCGDGIVGPGEDCDDGNSVGGDSCAARCTIPTPTATVTLSQTPAATPMSTPTVTGTSTDTPTRTVTGTPTISGTQTPTRSATSTPTSGFEPYLGYGIRIPREDSVGAPIPANTFPMNWVLTIDDLLLNNADADDPENFKVTRATHVFNAATFDGSLGPHTPLRHYLRYDVKPGRESVADAEPNGDFPRPARHVQRTWQLNNALGTLNVRSKRLQGLLVTASIEVNGSPPAIADATHYACYKVEPTHDVTAQTPDRGDGTGTFRRDIQAFVESPFFDDCARLADGVTTSFGGTPAEGACLFDVRAPVELCNPVIQSEVLLPRVTSATGIGSFTTSTTSLLCYEVRLARMITAPTAAAVIGQAVGTKLDPMQAGHAAHNQRNGNPVQSTVASNFPGPVTFNTVRTALACVPTDVVGIAAVP